MSKGLREKQNTVLLEDQFSARDYIATYYPNTINPTHLLETARMLKTAYAASHTVTPKEVPSHVDFETIENVAIFEFHREIVHILSKAFPHRDASILDMGGGPTIYQHIVPSLIAKRIVHSDFLRKNRHEVIRWLRKHESAYNWDSYFVFAKKMLKRDRIFMRWLDTTARGRDRKARKHAVAIRRILQAHSIDLLKHHVRQAIGSRVAHGDILRDDLALPSGIPSTFDIITATFVVEGATTNRTAYKRGMRNILHHIRPGGFFVNVSVRNSNWYQVGTAHLPAAPVDEDFIWEICTSSGYTVLLQRVLRGSNKKKVGYDGVIFTLAQKAS